MPYSPNDSNITVEALDFLHSPAGRELRDAVAQLAQDSELRTQNFTPAQVTALRKRFPQDAVHAALTLAQLQPKAKQKFPNLAATGGGFIYALPEALEQATDAAIAVHKAAQFAKALPPGGTILDLCSGIGGDTLALANVAPTTAIDLSAPRLTCLRFNHENVPAKHSLITKQGDVTDPSHLATLSPCHPVTLFHIDPARRSEGKRSPKFADLIPGPDFLQKLINTKNFPGGAIKLSSAVDFDSLPEGHLEIISHNQTVVQAILWTGTLAQSRTRSVSEGSTNLRTATVFKNHHLLFTYTAIPHPVKTPPFSIQHSSFSILYEADPALTRSQLAAPLAQSLHLTPLTIDAGYLLGQELAPHPALTPFQLHQILPYSESKLLKALQELSLPPSKSTTIEVKTRGKLLGGAGIDTDHLQKLLTAKTANHPAKPTVFIFKPIGNSPQIHAAITTRLPQTL